MTREEEDREVRKWVPFLWSLVNRMPLPFSLSTEEAMAEALLGCLQAIRTYDPARGKLAPRVAVMARSRVLDCLRDADHLSRPHRRKVRARKTHDVRLWPLEKKFEWAEPAEKNHGLLDIDDRDEVARILSRLNPKEREVVRLVWIEGYTGVRASREMGVSESRVSRLLKVAMAQMKQWSTNGI